MNVDAIHHAIEAAAHTPPVLQPRPKPPCVAQSHALHAGVLDEQHTVAALRERGGQLLRILPVERPVDRRQANDRGAAEHHCLMAALKPPTSSMSRVITSTAA